jgi:hypothetical protein
MRVKAHIRKVKGRRIRVRGHRRRRKRDMRIGTSWVGDRYIHGPRRHMPSRYDKIRLGKPSKTGRRIVWGCVKGTNKWERQSVLRPRKNQGFFLTYSVLKSL